MIEKVNKSIKLLQNLEKEQYNLGFSGGKDSIVILDLAKKSGVKFEAVHSNTTIDPPGTLNFIREMYPEVKIVNPDLSFYQLIIKKGLPTKRMRFCCEHLKERYGIGKRTIDGTRWDEGNKRKHYTPEDCDTRKWMKGAVHIRPILNWTNYEIWKYIKENKLPYLKYYDPPYKFKRHGCVGCPLTNAKVRMSEYRLFPKYFYAVLKAIKKHMINKPDNMIAQSFCDEYEAFYWWLSYKSIRNYVALRESSIFPICDYKELVLNSVKK